MIIYSVWVGAGEIPARYREPLEYSAEKIKACGHEHHVIRISPIVKTSPQEAANIKDRLVLTMACYESAGFADCDVYVEYVPDLKPGTAAFAYEAGLPRVSLFYVNDCQWYFEHLQRKMKGLKIAEKYGYPNQLLRGEAPQVVPEDSYVHKRLMTARF
jgi:hypothetical protein